MPLLRKQPFHKQKPPPDLHPEEEVFHCKITNEIFRNYEAFFERIILCNSLVWSCAITGRGGMTYQEAVDCEERAKQHLATFQENLQRPLLFLATLTHRSRLADLNDDVFLFAKDRYFIGETVDVSVGGERKVARVLSVTVGAPTKATSNGDVIVIDEDSESDDASKRSLLDPDHLAYVVQPLGSKSASVTVKASQVSRKRGLYTRDKSKLFLKQHCEPVMGVWTVKDDKLIKLGLKSAKFEDFCGGPKPMFAASVIKRKSKKPAADSDISSFSVTPDRSTQSQHSYAKSQEPGVTLKHEQPSRTPEERLAQRAQQKQEKLAEKIAKREEMKRKLEEEKQKRKEEREKEREKKREERRLQIEQLKEWSRPREDMECDDLKPLPDLTQVRTRVPSSVFGDAVMVLEFVNAFKNIFDFKQFFPKGFTWAHLETALMEADPEGPLCDLLQMLLCAIFNLQEEEAEEYQELEREDCHKDSSTQNTGEEEQVEEEISISNNELIRSATVAAQFSQQTFGMPLRDTLLDQFTLTEVLRLHLSSSGARASSKNARFRYQQRGGYSSLDDPGLELRKQEPGLLKKLQAANVFDLSPGEKVRLLAALVQQVATYAAVRDIMEESFDKLRLQRYDLKQMQWAEQRREREEAASRYRRLIEERLRERERRLQQMVKAGEHQGMGTLTDCEKSAELTSTTLPALETESVASSEEREKLEAKEREEEVAKRAAFMQKELEMLQQIFELQRCNALCPLGRDRFYRRYWMIGSLPAVLVEDNELFTGNPTVSGEDQGSAMPQLTRHDEGNTSSDKENDLSAVVTRVSDKAPSVCGPKEDCIVISDEEGESKTNHANVDEPPQLDASQCLSQHVGQWYVLDSRASFDQLMASLNPRGFRESSLHAALQDMRPLVNVITESFPLDCCTGARETTETLGGQSIARSTGRKVQEHSTNMSASEAMEMTLRDLLLDLDDRIFAGSLGALKVEDRTAWREALQQGHYDPQTDDPTFARQDSLELDNSVAMEPAARDLGKALVQIARGIEPRFLCAPLEDGGGEGSRSRVYDRWEESSLAVASLSQVFLHLATLDRSVKWDRSALLARCRICRRKGDADKMLLCDGCDRGHHMYCLKPPMTKVPPGDWFCWDCRPKEPRPSPRKNRRRTFSEMSDEESGDEVLSLEDTVEEASNEEEAEDSVCNFEEDDEEEEENEDICAECHQDGKLILCDVCPRSYHLHCASPQLKKVPRGKWMCQVCVGGNRAGKIHFPKPQQPARTSCKAGKKASSSKMGKSSGPGSRRESPAASPRGSPAPLHSTRAKARESSEKELSPRVRSREAKTTPKSKTVPEKDITTRPRTQEKEAIKHKRSSSAAVHVSQSSDFETNIKQYTSSKRGNSQVQQMRVCEELVQELMRHEDAWPFLKPVDKRLVPDYYDVITSPMDLSTIRNRVHSFRYNTPAELVADIRLIFSNCVEYNARTTPEYRAGQNLAKFFQTRVRELGIHAEAEATPPTAKKLRR